MNRKILVPICNDCNKPHTGRSKVEDRCICDTVGNWGWGEIEEEDVATTRTQRLITKIKELNYCTIETYGEKEGKFVSLEEVIKIIEDE